MKQVTIMTMTGVTLCLTLASCAPMNMTLRSTSTAKSWVHINFYGDTFSEFYKCLSTSSSVACVAALARDGKQPMAVNSWRVVDVNKPETNVGHDDLSDYFSCRFILPEKQVSCRRLDSTEVKCQSQTMTQHFHLLNDSTRSSSGSFSPSSSISLSCVAVIWGTRGESLNWDREAHVIAVCGSGCNSSSTTTARTKKTIPSTRASLWQDQDEDDHNREKPRHPIEDSLDTKSHVIIAVVIAMSVSAILIVAAAFFRKKLLQRRTPPKAGDEGDKAASRHTKGRRFVPTGTISLDVPLYPNSIILDPSKLTSDT